MSVKEIKALERRFFEAMNRGLSAISAVIDDDCSTSYVYHSGLGSEIRGTDAFKQFMSGFGAFSDLHVTLDDMIVEGDKAVSRHTFTGTHKGEWRGLPPTNKKVTFWAIMIVRIVGGKQVEIWERSDTLGLMQQLGLCKQ